MVILKLIFHIILVSFCINSSTAIFKFGQDDEHKETLPFFSGNRPRISIFSKPPDPEAPKLMGPNILGHVNNVMQGGTIGVEFQMKPGGVNLPGILDNAKKIIPGGPTYPQVGRPENQKPPPEPYDPPKGGSWEEEDDTNLDIDETNDWEPENPEKPIPDGPSWDDIGEDPEDDPSIPYEEIINPRLKPQRRPKRSIRN